MNIALRTVLLYSILFLSFTAVSYKDLLHIAHAVDQRIQCIEAALQNKTMSLDCDNLDLDTTTDPCSSVMSWMDLARVPLNETRQSLQTGNITGAMSNLNITDRMFQQLKDDNAQSNITLGNFTLSSLPSDHPCNIAQDVEEKIIIPLNETRQSLQTGNITGAMSNLNITDSMLEELKLLIEIQSTYITGAIPPP